jgi:iron complex transport system substrate-binding protein
MPWQPERSRALSALLAAIALLLAGARLARAAPMVDDDQHTLALTKPAARIISLAPGATAMLFAAGAGAQIVGTSDYSDEPPAAEHIERVGDSRTFDLERILALHPDVIVAWSSGNSTAQIDKLERAGLPVYRHRIARLTDIPDSVRRLGVLAGTEPQAQAAANALAAKITALEQRYASANGGTILIQVWDHPIYTVGRAELMSDEVRICGYRSVYADLTEPAPAVSLESVLARDPDVILEVGQDQATANDWAQRWRAYPSLKAVRNGRLIPWVDRRLTRLGPSIVDATEALCAALAR